MIDNTIGNVPNVSLTNELLKIEWKCSKNCGHSIVKTIKRLNGGNWVVDRHFIYTVKNHKLYCGGVQRD